MAKNPIVNGSKTMSQRDAMGKAMNSAYESTYGKVPAPKKAYGMPRGAALKSAAKSSASKLFGGLGAK